jgi:hypothetical protein
MDGQPDQSKVGCTTCRCKRVFVILACLVTLYVAYRFVLFFAVEAKIASIRRAGLPASCAELDKWYAHVPAGENAADLYIQANEHYNEWTNALPQPVVITNTTATWTNSFRITKKWELLPVVGMVDLPPRTEPLPAEMKQLVSEYLADNTEALRLLHQAASMKRCRFPVDLSKGDIWSVQPNLSQLKQGVRLLYLEAIENSENQRPEQAAESVIASLGIARALNQKPTIISRLVANACQGVSIASLQHVLNRTSLTDEQLAKLAVAFVETEDPQGLTRASIGERCLGIDGFDRIRSGKVAIEDVFLFSEIPPSFVLALYRPAGLLRLDELVYFGFAQDFVKVTQLSPPQRVAAIQALTANAKQLPFYAVLSRRTIDALGSLVTRDVEAIASTRTAVAALAIERYRLAKGDLPDKLDDIVPTYLNAIPQDPFDGKPLRYRKLARGYVVYSIGRDGEDNGGAEKNGKGFRIGKGTDITFIVER